MHVLYIGDVPSVDASQMPKLEVDVYVTEAVVEGDVLVVDTAVTTYGMGTHAKKSTATVSGGGKVIGGALYAAPSGGIVKARTQGPQDNVKCNNTGASAGVNLVVDSGNAGQLLLDPGNTAAEKGIANVLVAASGGRATVYWRTGFGGTIA